MKATAFSRCVSTITALVTLAVPCARADEKPVHVECTGHKWDMYGNFLTEFRLSNDSPNAVGYTGYGPAAPIYEMQLRHLVSWADYSQGAFCGTGLNAQKLDAGKSVTFALLPPGGHTAWRLGISYLPNSPTADIREKWPIAWTSSIPGMSEDEVEKAELELGEMAELKTTHHPDRELSYTFQLTNRSDKILFYAGYTDVDCPDVWRRKKSPFPPLYLQQELRTEGWHDQGNGGLCGSLEMKSLKPGQTLVFSLWDRGFDKPWRVGLRFYRSKDPHDAADAYRRVWWQQCPPRENTDR